MSRTKVAFIVLNYNDSDTTKNLIDSLLLWDTKLLDIHFIVVDNCSSDNSYYLLQERYRNYKQIDVIQSEYNGGYSYGNNFGAKYAIDLYQPEYIAIANPDIMIDEFTFENLLSTFDKSDVVMVAPVCMDAQGKYSIHSQALPAFKDDLVRCFNSNYSQTLLDENIFYDDEKKLLKTEMIVGCFFVIRTDIFIEIGMFDESTFLFCEERILGKKLNNLGYKMCIRTDLFFIHAHSVSIKKSMDIVKTWKWIMKSRYYYEKEYNNCNYFQLLILKINMKLFIIGLSLKLLLYKVIKRTIKKFDEEV